MMYITSPAKDKGTAFLMNDKEVWNWVPSINRTVKMPPSMMMQSWMGTDLTNDDLVQQSSEVEDYDHQLLGKENIDGSTCYVVQLTPKPDAAVVWGKIIMWIDSEEFFRLRTEFYDDDEDLVNKMIASNVQVMGGKTLPTRIEVIPMDKTGQKTVLEYQKLQFDIDIEESFFTPQQMKRLK
ncbi:MAG: outer membrane lipoprotein-sorting protein, partial [Flavobacteriales bacterium]|nr:outer membrane lipoprotein-sorting protein [Flavobacteriales bacterium]